MCRAIVFVGAIGDRQRNPPINLAKRGTRSTRPPSNKARSSILSPRNGPRGTLCDIAWQRVARATLRRITSTIGIRAFVQADASRNRTRGRETPARGFSARRSSREIAGIARQGDSRVRSYIFFQRSLPNHFRISRSRSALGKEQIATIFARDAFFKQKNISYINKR